MAPWPIEFWNKWAIQILVLLSFMLQIFLLILAGIRRREASTVLRFLLWLAYQLADSTAIYALGLLSLSGVPREHRLVAFWATFLLLHLGGPDNITAYSLEDSKLWKRHFLTVLLQVFGVVYVLYEHIVRSSRDMVLAAILMFFVGFVKYTERTRALWCSNMGSIRSSLNRSRGANNDRYTVPKGVKGQFDEQVLLEVAHSLLHFCKLKLVDSSVNMEHPDLVRSHLEWNDTWKLIEMELSLLYDILYTKAAVIHTWFGYCIRFTTPFATASAFLLFHLSNNGSHDGHSGVDVVITYGLFAGAFFMEVWALLGAIGSTWTLAFLRALPQRWSWLRHALVCSGRWHRLQRLLVALGWQEVRRRRWSGNIGQYNLLDFCTRDTSDPLGKLKEIPLLKEWWNKFHYSETFKVTKGVKKLVFDRHRELMSRSDNVNALGLLREKWGKKALENSVLHEEFKERDHLLGVELQEGILIWHIATDVFLANREGQDQDQDDAATLEVVVAIRALSDYMMFLLVRRPYLLPGLVLHRMYEIACDNLVQICHDLNKNHSRSSSSRKQLAEALYKEKQNFDGSDHRVRYGVDVAKKLLNKKGDEEEAKGSVCKALFKVWMDFLSYTANRCSRESYAMKLNNGGELTAILWLMAAHFQPDNRTSSGQ